LHPQLQIDLVLDDRFVDLAEERIDLAVRVGVITDTNLVCRALPPVRRVALASPQYLAQRGVPRHPNELSMHDCVVYTRLATGARWTFECNDQPIEVEVKGPIKVNNSSGVLAAVVAGAGIGVVPMFALTDQLERGEVRVVLEDFEPRALPMHIVYASRRHVPAKLRLAIEFLLESLAEGS
jgi:DNA-binding transcriptional LysR family regulator